MKKLNLAAVAVACIAWLAACGPSADTTMKVETPLQSQGRIEVTRIGIISDGTAYDSRRGIYIIKDNKTGQEFIGVSGVGIAETGSHLAGKVVIQDER